MIVRRHGTIAHCSTRCPPPRLDSPSLSTTTHPPASYDLSWSVDQLSSYQLNMGTATTATAPPPPPVSQATAPALSAQTFKRLHPHAYLDRFLLEGYRPDGRSLPTSSSSSVDSWRDVTVNVGSVSTASGSALVRLGETTIVCGVKAEIFEPDLYSPEEGCIGMSCCGREGGKEDRRMSKRGRTTTRRGAFALTVTDCLPVFAPSVPNVDLPALCSPKFKPGPPGNEAQILTDRLHRILSECVFVSVLRALTGR